MSVSIEKPTYLSRHDIPLIDLPTQQLLEKKHCFLELYENYLVYSAAFVVNEKEEDEESLGMWQEKRHDLYLVIRKETVASVSICYHDTNKCWQVRIDVQGGSTDVFLYMLTRKEAKEVYKDVEAWYLETKAI